MPGGYRRPRSPPRRGRSSPAGVAPALAVSTTELGCERSTRAPQASNTECCCNVLAYRRTRDRTATCTCRTWHGSALGSGYLQKLRHPAVGERLASGLAAGAVLQRRVGERHLCDGASAHRRTSLPPFRARACPSVWRPSVCSIGTPRGRRHRLAKHLAHLRQQVGDTRIVQAVGRLERAQPGGVQDLVGVGVADPPSRFWSRSTPFNCERPAAFRTAAKSSTVNPFRHRSGPGPRCRAPRTGRPPRRRRGVFWVPASVRLKPSRRRARSAAPTRTCRAGQEPWARPRARSPNRRGPGGR